MIRPTRREALQTLAALAALSGLRRLSFAQGPETERRLVLIFLRGGMDGLSAVPAYGDPDYESSRGALAIAAPGAPGGALKLDERFALNPLLPGMHELYGVNELVVLHAIASQHRDRSHFDAQNLAENGTSKPYGRQEGWLNLALADGAGLRAVALGSAVPLSLRGPVSVSSWSPSATPDPDPALIDLLADLYRDDSLLARPFAEARELRGVTTGLETSGPASATDALVAAAGRFLARPDGPRVATLDIDGWDTHQRQAGQYSSLTRSLRVLDRSIVTLKRALGEDWKKTAILIVTEFGRTVAMNGSGGTDHGIAGAAFVAGGVVRGGRVIADWPGLSPKALYEGRDLAPTLDLRALFKAVLRAQLGTSESALETSIFPDSRGVKPLEGLFA